MTPRDATADLRRRSRADLPIAAALAVMTLAVSLYFAPRGFHLGFVDMGHDGYQLRQVLDLSHGGVIFKDTFDQYGPLNGYINLVGFLTLGRRLLALKYFICLWYAAIVILLYAIARRWLEPPLAAFTMIVWLGLAPFYNHGIMISPHVYVLFLQGAATLIALRTEDLSPRRFAVIGLLAGVSWAIKENMGAFFLVALLSYLLLERLLGRAGSRRVALAAAAMTLTFAAVVAITVAALWRFGALGDWYLQTVVFPRDFYLAASTTVGPDGTKTAISQIVNPLAAFANLQWRQPLYWIVIRAVVLVTALFQVIRRQPDDDLLLMASITACLWFGAYPSGNFMHQWWTASLTIAPFVVCVRRLMTRIAAGPAAPFATVVVVLMIVGSGIVERWGHTVYRAQTLTETIAEPPLFRGIRTDPATKRALAWLYQGMARYRSDHPGTGVVSIESADGWGSGIIESLPFLSFFEDNTNPQPVYWSLPVLSTTVYPKYGEKLWRHVRDEHPLIVSHRYGKYEVVRISGYRLLAAAQSDYGHWFVYAPSGAASTDRQLSAYLASDGASETFSEGERFPTLTRRLSSAAEGGWRGTALPSFRRDDTIQIPGDDPFTLVDPGFDSSRPVNVYTWPADLPDATIRGPIQPATTDVTWRAGVGDIVRELRPGAWTVSGNAAASFAYLLQWGQEPIDRGRTFIVRGEVSEGGLQVGFLERGHWAGYVTVTREGPFEAVIQIQKSGRYSLVLANCITSSWAERAQLHPIRSVVDSLAGGSLSNRFRVSQAGWVPPAVNIGNPD